MKNYEILSQGHLSLPIFIRPIIVISTDKLNFEKLTDIFLLKQIHST
jgi:hypothetical protein